MLGSPRTCISGAMGKYYAKMIQVERILQREIEQEIEVPRYVEVKKNITHHNQKVLLRAYSALTRW